MPATRRRSEATKEGDGAGASTSSSVPAARGERHRGGGRRNVGASTASGMKWDVVLAVVVALVSGTVAVSMIRDELRPGRACGLSPFELSDAGKVSPALFTVHRRDGGGRAATTTHKGEAAADHGHTFAIRSTRVVFEKDDGLMEGGSAFVMEPATVYVRGGKVVDVIANFDSDDDDESEAEGEGIVDFGNLVVMPGLVDTHVHLNEPGRTEWEGFYTGTRAAAAGGVTALVDMPLNCIPSTIDPASLTQKLASTYGKLTVDVAFFGGLTLENAGDEKLIDEKLAPLLDSGVVGLKAFLPPPGTEEFSNVNRTPIEAAVPLLRARGLPLLVHAELEGPVPPQRSGSPTRYKTYQATRPPEWERNAISMLLDVWQKTAATSRLHIVHLADSGSLDMLNEAKSTGRMNLTVETAPHYLYFSEEDIPMGSTLHKCAPPIRSEANREALWSGLLGDEGTIDFLASDHSPAPPEDKEMESGDFLKAWGGISGLQFSLPVTWTEGRHRGLTIPQIAEIWSRRPAALVGLGNKGRIAAGADADFVVWDPEEEFMVGKGGSEIFHQHPQTPYAGSKLSGKVIATFVRGAMVFLDGKHSTRSCGRPLLRNDSEDSANR